MGFHMQHQEKICIYLLGKEDGRHPIYVYLIEDSSQKFDRRPLHRPN